jgi:hypothetical protein
MVGGKDISSAHGVLAARSFLFFRAYLEQFYRKTMGQDLILRSICKSIGLSAFHTFGYAKKLIIHHMKHNKLSHYILSLLLSTALLCGCNKHPMTAMSEEEDSFQESVGGITILEAEHLEAMDLARVPAIIDVAQGASAHGLSASREIVGVPDPLAVTELQVVIKGNRARKKVISQQNAALLAGAAALGGYVTNSLFTWQSASKQQEKQAQEHQKLANRIRTLEEALSLPATIDVNTTSISQASDAICVSGTHLVPPSVSVSQSLPVGLCTLLVGGYLARKIQCCRTALATAEKEARAARDQEIVQTRNALAAVARANTARDEAVVRANTEKYEAIARVNTARDEAVARANREKNEAVARENREKDEAIARANTVRDEAVARANREKDEAIARANTEKDAAIARVNTARDEAVAKANREKDEAIARASTEKEEAIARANIARDEAVARANEAVVRANTEKDEAIARANEAVEDLAARDQEIAQTRNALAAALMPLGEAEWKQYFGDVRSAPSLPSDIATILDGPCPFWPNKKVRDTHLLVLIPATVGGVPFTLNRIGELIKHPSHGGHRTEYRCYNERVKAQIGEESPPRSYWVLMTRDVLPGSRNTGYAHQKALVAGYASRESVPYALPSVLEAATAILMHHAREGERLFGDHPRTYTRCQEVVDGRDPAIVGGFESSVLHVDVIHFDFYVYLCGVACCRKF